MSQIAGGSENTYLFFVAIDIADVVCAALLAVEVILLTAVTVFGSLAIYHFAIRLFFLMRMVFRLRTARSSERDRMRDSVGLYAR